MISPGNSVFGLVPSTIRSNSNSPNGSVQVQEVASDRGNLTASITVVTLIDIDIKLNCSIDYMVGKLNENYVEPLLNTNHFSNTYTKLELQPDDATQFEICKFLINESLLDINVSTRWGWTPLHQCAFQGNIEIAQFLMDNGAKVNVVSSLGITPLMYAANNANLEIVKFLIKNGANLNIRNNSGRLVLDLALQCHPSKYVFGKLADDVDALKNIRSEIVCLLYIVRHLDTNPSMDSFINNDNRFDTQKIQEYYNNNSETINCLMVDRINVFASRIQNTFRGYITRQHLK